MFWLIRKIFGLGVLVAIVFFALQYHIGNRTVKDYVSEFFQSSLVQGKIHEASESVKSFFQKEGNKGQVGAPTDDIPPEDEAELKKVLKKESKSK